LYEPGSSQPGTLPPLSVVTVAMVLAPVSACHTVAGLLVVRLVIVTDAPTTGWTMLTESVTGPADVAATKTAVGKLKLKGIWTRSETLDMATY
jgi:hypothetical protein